MKNFLNYAGVIFALLLFFFLFFAISYFIGKRSCPPCPPDGYVMVKKQWLDSLQKVNESKPQIIEITRDSIIHVSGPIRYVGIPTPIPIDDQTNYFIDTLKSPHFELYLFDTLKNNLIINRGFTYNLFVPEKITTTITQIQKVPFPYEIDLRGRLYGGINVGMVNGVDINYRLAGRNDMIGLGFGYINQNKLIYGRYTFKIR
jgi:hypothetical protein